MRVGRLFLQLTIFYLVVTGIVLALTALFPGFEHFLPIGGAEGFDGEEYRMQGRFAADHQRDRTLAVGVDFHSLLRCGGFIQNDLPDRNWRDVLKGLSAS